MLLKSDRLKFLLVNISLALMFALPLFPSKIKPLIISIFGLSVLISNIGEQIRFDNKKFIINGGVYLLMALSLIYSENLGYGFSKLETMSSLVIFPFIFSLFPASFLDKIRNNTNKYLLVYVLSVFIFNLISFVYHFNHYNESLIIHYPTVNRIAQGPFNIHPIYLSMHICVAVLFSFFIIKNEKRSFKKYIIIFLDVLLIAFLVILLKKGPIIALSIISLFFIILNRNKISITIVLISIFSVVIAVVNIPQYKNKFLEFTKIEDIRTGEMTSTNIRYTIYRIAIENILESPLIGYGIGDYKKALTNDFKEDYENLYVNKYNAHNQYLSFALALGILGFSFFVFFLVYNLILAIKFENQLLGLIVIFYGLIMLFENILEREDGVIYFSFFVGYFSLPPYFKKQLRKIKSEK